MTTTEQHRVEALARDLARLSAKHGFMGILPVELPGVGEFDIQLRGGGIVAVFEGGSLPGDLALLVIENE